MTLEKILLLTLLIVPASAFYPCIVWFSREIRDVCGGCGFCLEHQRTDPSDHGFRCEWAWPLQNYFDGELKCTVIDQCKSDKSKEICRGRKCLPMFGTFKCECDKTTFGNLCEFSKPRGVTDDDYADVADIILTPFMTIGQYGTMSFFFKNLGRNLVLSIETYWEDFVFNSKICEDVVIKDYCRKWYDSYPHMCINNPRLQGKLSCVMTITFMFPPIDVKDFFLYQTYPNFQEGTGVPFAIRELIMVKVWNHLSSHSTYSTFNYTYDMIHLLQGVHLNYCAAIVYMTNAAYRMSIRTTYAMRDDIIITSTYTPHASPKCVGADNFMHHWKVWKVETNLMTVFQKPLVEVLKNTELRFKQFSLNVGIYKISLNVTSWQGQKKSFKFIYGYFEVIELDLEAVISGGEERSIYSNEEYLKLDGTQSRNPNVPPSQQLSSLKFYWRCNRTDVAFCRETRSDEFMIYKGPFLANEYYTFYLTIKSSQDDSKQDSTSQVVFMNSAYQRSFQLICRKNCGWRGFQSNPGVVVYIEAVVFDVTVDFESLHFDWTYSQGTSENYIPVDNIRQNKTPSSVLIVLTNTLSAGEEYIFQAKGVNLGEAKLLVKMAKEPSKVLCKVDSDFTNTTIIKGVTKFKVNCDQLKYRKFAPIYDFYDWYPGENGTSRLIASSRTSEESELVLSRGTLVVEITDEYGMIVHSEVSVKLTNIENVRKHIFDLFNYLRQNYMTLGANFKISAIFLMYDLIADDNYEFPDLLGVVEFILKICVDIEIEDIPVLKVMSSFLNSVASGLLKTNLSMNSINYVSKSVTNLSGMLVSKIKTSVNLTDISEITVTEVYKLCIELLKICDSIFESTVIDLEKKIVNEEDIQDYYASYRESSDLMVRSVRNIMSCLSLINLPFEWPTILKEDQINIWLKEDTPKAFSDESYERYEPVPSVDVSKVFSASADEMSKFVIIQVACFDNDPYFYHREFDIYTNTIDLRIMFKLVGNVLHVINISNPVVITLKHLGVETAIINGSVYQPDSNKSLDKADMQVAVHQLRVPTRGRLDLKFLDLGDGQVIRVRVLFNKRPDFEFMSDNNKVFNITKSSPNYVWDLKAPQSRDIYDLYYIGILPGPEHQVNSYINYSFEMSTFHCVNWKFHEWITSDCKIKGVTESHELQCECKVFSTFAGFSQVPLNKFDPLDDYKLLLSETNNMFVEILLLSLLVAVLLLLILAIWKDCSNVKGKVIYLEDNFPGDKFSYLVAVFTGSKFFGGTTSNVGIMIEGDKACSRPHMLRSSWRRTLKKGEDDWFLLSTMSHLGNLQMIHLWTDYSGRRPEWYCYKVIIIDLLSHNQYLFLVDAWLSLRENSFIERFVKVIKSEDDKRLHMVVDNLIFGLRDTHLWLGVWFGHPRSVVSRAQRLVTAFNELLIIMLVTLLFLSVLENRSEDYPHYYLSARVLLITMLSVIISSTLVNILMSVFRKTFLFKVYKKKEENKAISNHKHKSTNFLFRCCEDFLKVLSNRKKFKPVILQFDKKGIPRKQEKYSCCCLNIGWTVTLALIIICFIAIYFLGKGMRKVKTLVWLTCIAISLLLILFLVAPLKILVLAVLSGLFFHNINQVVSYHIRMQLLAKYKRGLIDSQHRLRFKLISMRRHSCYLPLTYKKLMGKFYKQRKFDATLLLLDMFLIGVLLVLLFIQIESLWTTKYYWNNKQLRTLLKQGYQEEGVRLYSLTNLLQYSLFLEKNVFPVIYQTRWYNKQPIVHKNATVEERFVFGGTSKLIGLPRLRQLRLKPDLCQKPLYENLSQYCNVELTEDTKDTNLYAEGWVETGPRELFHELSPWYFMNVSETYDTTLFGYSNIAYKGDGYVAELDLAEEKAQDIVFALHWENWLDRRTCAVIFELTLYNAFSGTFSWLISVTENLHIGTLMHRVYVFTVSDEYEYPLIDLVFFLGLLMFTVRVFFVVNRNGIDDLTDDFWNLFEMIMVCLGLICAVLFILNINSKFNYFKKHIVGDTREQYFEFVHLLQYLDYFTIILSILLIMLVCRFMRSWRFGNNFFIIFKTFYFSSSAAAVLFLLLFLGSYLYWDFLSYMINDFMVSKHNFPVMSKIDFKHVIKSCKAIPCKISPFILCFISLIIQLFIAVLFLASFRIVKRKYVEIEPINFCTVFFERFKKYLLEIKDGRKKRVSIKY